MEVEGFPFSLNLGILGFLVLFLLVIQVVGNPDFPLGEVPPVPLYVGMVALGILSAYSMYLGLRELEERD